MATKVAGVVISLPPSVRVTKGHDSRLLRTDEGRTIRSCRAVWYVRTGCGPDSKGRVVAEFRGRLGEAPAQVRAFHRAAEEAGLTAEAAALLEYIDRVAAEQAQARR